jgi:hypothetical protein
MQIRLRQGGSPRAMAMDSGEPLWKVVPTHDEQGRPLGDFMMLIPGLRAEPQAQIENILNQIHCALVQFQEVVFVHLNLPLNLLWVSVRVRRGITLEVAAAVRRRVPQAVLIANKGAQ